MVFGTDPGTVGTGAAVIVAVIATFFLVATRARQDKDKRGVKEKPRCPVTGRRAGGVLLVAEYRFKDGQREPSLIVFHNRKGGYWECPYGNYDGLPKHPTIVHTAAAELWEETCALVDVPAQVLQMIAQRGHAKTGVSPGVFALRVDGLSRRQFYANRAAIQTLRDGGIVILRAALEMDGMTYVPLRNINACKSSASWHGHGAITANDIEGRQIKMAGHSLADQLRKGGLDMAWQAFHAGDMRRHVPTGWQVRPKTNPLRKLTGDGDHILHGVKTVQCERVC